ncbi:MAG: membrane-bound dehydrogenase domain-containing protein [Planctomycetota bacterium]|nr:MAG: membrane-bound dehydrogenase domain-containing protein [Planctomycetota bacterium]
MQRSVILWACLVGLSSQQARADDPPKSLDSRLKIELFAEHPQIVTPTGLDVDHRGRVFAIESNTHFPPEGYKGHPTDRVLVMSDTDGDGKADKIVVFKDGLRHSMSVVVRPLWFPVRPMADGREPKADISNSKSQISNPKQSIYVATRCEILQLHDDDGDDKADRQERIVHLDTKGDYPHNGLAGFAIDALGWMYFGFGENLGADYKIIGSDGTTLSGGGEGGNIYRCRLDGSKLSQIATGFWNPHASCFDAFGRLFTVDNDADSRPPCRLLHVIPGGDYGYRFRNGRKGLHPFTAWNGEIPGTLPMVAGTGEAPSGILAYESDGLPEEYLGNLLVTSWGDHRIDRFRLQPQGTSFTSLAEPLITGSENFRPVGLATAPDGSLFCTDWVLRDYKLHGHGRIWRITTREPQPNRAPIPDFESKSVDVLKAGLADRRLWVRRQASKSIFPKLESQLQNQLLLESSATSRSHLEICWAVIPRGFMTAGEPHVKYSDIDPANTWVFLQPNLLFGRRLSKGRIATDGDLQTARMKDLEAVFAAIIAGRPSTQIEPSSILPQLLQCQIEPDSTLLRLALSIDDPFLFSVVVSMIAKQFNQDDFAKYLIADATPDVKASAPRVRQAMLLASRKQAPREDRLLRVALADHDPDVRRLAVQWAAEEKLTDLRPKLEAIFGGKPEVGSGKGETKSDIPTSALRIPTSPMTPELFLATLAALEMLDGKKPEDFDKTPAEQYVVPLLKDKQRSPAVRAQALRLVSPTDKSLDAPLFASLLKSDHEPLRLETVRTLQGAKPEIAGPLLHEVVADASRISEQTRDASATMRAEALVGLAAVAKSEPVGGPTRKLLRTFLNNSSPVPLRLEALRAARSLIKDDPELRDGMLEIAKSLKALNDGEIATELADQIGLAFAEAKLDPPQELKPFTSAKPKDRQEWMAQLNRGRDADPAAGRRVFFHLNGAGCFKCHIVDGRGGRVGPDLSRAVGNMNRIQLIQSILEPSREIAPQFVSWTFELKDGKVVTGMVVHENEGKTIVGNAEGQLIEIKTIDIETRTPQKISVMPEKLAERMTLQELRDVIAFLDSQR